MAETEMTKTNKKRSSKELKQAIREEILHNFGTGFEPVTKASYIAIRLIGETDNCAAIFGSKGGQSLWIKQSAANHLPEIVDTRDVSTWGRGWQIAVDIADEEDPNLGLAVLAVKATLSSSNDSPSTEEE